MISTVLLVAHIIFVAIMIGLILIQKSEGGALGMGGGNLMSARGSANLLTRSTGVMAALFFVSTILLAISFKGSNSSQSILDDVVEDAPVSTVEKDASKPSLPAAPKTMPAAPKAPVK